MTDKIKDVVERSKRSLLWEEIYRIVDRLQLKETDGDCIDKPSVTTELEKLWMQSQSQWIPVSERLPNNTRNRNVYTYDGYSTYGYLGRDKRTWISAITDEVIIATHWMEEFPEPPKAEPK